MATRDHIHSQNTTIVYFKLNQFSNAQVAFQFGKCNSKTNVCLCTNYVLNQESRGVKLIRLLGLGFYGMVWHCSSFLYLFSQEWKIQCLEFERIHFDSMLSLNGCGTHSGKFSHNSKINGNKRKSSYLIFINSLSPSLMKSNYSIHQSQFILSQME